MQLNALGGVQGYGHCAVARAARDPSYCNTNSTVVRMCWWHVCRQVVRVAERLEMDEYGSEFAMKQRLMHKKGTPNRIY